jgi:hypothetical protein
MRVTRTTTPALAASTTLGSGNGPVGFGHLFHQGI